MTEWEISPDLSPWNYNKLNSYNPTENTQPSTQIHLGIRVSEHLRWTNQVNKGEAKGKEQRPVLQMQSTAPYRMWGEKGELGGTFYSFKSRSFFPSDQYMLWWNQWSGQRKNTERLQLCSKIHHCQAESCITKPGYHPLPPLSSSSLPHTFPKLTVNPSTASGFWVSTGMSGALQKNQTPNDLHILT